MKGLREHRLDKMLTIRELAAMANVSPQTIVRAEQGLRTRLRSMRQIADALGIDPRDVTEFVTGLEKEARHGKVAADRRTARTDLG